MLAAIVAFLINFIIAPLTLGWKFDKVFDKKRVTCVDPCVPYFSTIVRCMVYMVAIVLFDVKNHRPKLRISIGPECQQYDFRKHASRFEMAISFIYLYSSAIWIPLAFPILISKWYLGV
jgi:hypothetical protein